MLLQEVRNDEKLPWPLVTTEDENDIQVPYFIQNNMHICAKNVLKRTDYTFSRIYSLNIKYFLHTKIWMNTIKFTPWSFVNGSMTEHDILNFAASKKNSRTREPVSIPVMPQQFIWTSETIRMWFHYVNWMNFRNFTMAITPFVESYGVQKLHFQ